MRNLSWNQNLPYPRSWTKVPLVLFTISREEVIITDVEDITLTLHENTTSSVVESLPNNNQPIVKSYSG